MITGYYRCKKMNNIFLIKEKFKAEVLQVVTAWPGFGEMSRT